MKSINDYTIYCTKEQTHKALELGTSLQEHPFCASIIKANEKMFSNLICINEKYYALPTAEQMIGWLESQGCVVEYCRLYRGNPLWAIFVNEVQVVGKYYESRTAAIYAAIDAALEYLIQNKK